MSTSNLPLTDSPWGVIDPSPMCYRNLAPQALASELRHLSAARTIGTTHCVTFQPCLEAINQDRYDVQEWDLPSGKWTFAAVFDGHAGVKTVEHVVEVLPRLIRTSLTSILTPDNGFTLSPSAVSDLLIKTIADFDRSILDDLLGLFPGGSDAINRLSDSEINSIINDFDSGGTNHTKVLRCMQGSTVLVSLVDPEGLNLWVCSLGDCQAVLGTKNSSGAWTSTLLSSNHNGHNNEEVTRIRQEHPEDERDKCVLDDRVFGVLAVTRAIGDYCFKLPASYTKRIFLKANPGFSRPDAVREFISHNLTPPYISNQADVRHVNLTLREQQERFLIMCSDGFVDLYMYDETRASSLEHIAAKWVSLVNLESDEQNEALRLLRDAIGGEDEDRVARNLTRRAPVRWIDDTTILVVRL